jgi:DNA segregation ATPase FtsK/SpoIIIE, S-DNA-T family
MAEAKKIKPPAKKAKKPAEKAPENQVHSYDNHFWSVILFSVGLLILFLTLIKGSSGWYELHKIIRGLFGVSVFFVSPILVYASVIIAKDASKDTITARMMQGVFFTFLMSAIVQVIFIGDVGGVGIKYKLTMLYSQGIELKSGGLMSALIGLPLLKIFGDLGAKIIILIFLFIVIMLLANITLLDLFHLLKQPIKITKNSLVKTREFNLGSKISKMISMRNIDDYEDDNDLNKIEIEEEKNPDDKEIIKSIRKIEKKKLFPEIKSNKNIKSEKPSLELSENNVDENNLDILSILASKHENIDSTIIKSNSSSIDISIGDNLNEKSNDENIKKDIVPVFSGNKYVFPPMDLLKKSEIVTNGKNSVSEMEQAANTLVETLKSFGVQTKIVDIHRGPTVTRYELQPSAGVKISKITSLADDIALNLAAAGVRIEAPIPGKAAVGIEIPNNSKDMVSLREMLESEEFANSKSKLSFAVGKDIAGKVIIGDIAKMPHVIIAGATGSGKSVCTNSIIMSILYKASPEQVKLVLIDPKIVEFKVYDGIPHLLIPVVTDPRKAAGALNWAVQEMLKRYKIFADNNVRDLMGYNEIASEKDGLEPLPQIVIAIDELADLMMAASNDVEDAICRLAQMARAAGMHLIIATQRPTVDIITGLIKANIPSRIALSVMSQTDSRTILDTGGADKLLGQGDMLYFPSGIPKPIRVQGCFCSTKEIESVVNYIKSSTTEVDYNNEVIDEIEKNVPLLKGDKKSNNNEETTSPETDDDIIEKAIDMIVETGQASTSSLQRKFKLGYSRAARIVDELENMGIIGPPEGSKPRKVIITKMQWAERKMRQTEN